MDIETPNTKTALILAAGPLFAQKGEEGVSVRTIAGIAGANVASINYHFGSKENLYLATVRYVVEKLGAKYFYEAWQALPHESRNWEGIRTFVRDFITETFLGYVQSENPAWFFALLQREISNPTAAFQTIKQDCILPDRDAARELFALVKPGHAKWEPEVWLSNWHGNIFFFCNSFNSLRDIYHWSEALDPEFIQQSLRSTIRMTLALLEPEPQ